MINQLKTDKMINSNFFFELKETNSFGQDMYDVISMFNESNSMVIFHGTFDNCVKYLEMVMKCDVRF